jgi:hypothetical protein
MAGLIHTIKKDTSNMVLNKALAEYKPMAKPATDLGSLAKMVKQDIANQAVVKQTDTTGEDTKEQGRSFNSTTKQKGFRLKRETSHQQFFTQAGKRSKQDMAFNSYQDTQEGGGGGGDGDGDGGEGDNVCHPSVTEVSNPPANIEEADSHSPNCED